MLDMVHAYDEVFNVPRATAGVDGKTGHTAAYTGISAV